MDILLFFSIVLMLFFFTFAYLQKNPIFAIFSAILSFGIVSKLEFSFISIVLIFFAIYDIFITIIYFKEFKG